MGEQAGGRLKPVFTNTCEEVQEVHLLVKLPTVSLQDCKFTKNELLYTYFSRILARFKVIICVLEFQGHLFFKVPFHIGFFSYRTCNNSHTCKFNLLEKCFSFLLFIPTHSYLSYTTSFN